MFPIPSPTPMPPNDLLVFVFEMNHVLKDVPVFLGIIFIV